MPPLLLIIVGMMLAFGTLLITTEKGIKWYDALFAIVGVGMAVVGFLMLYSP